MNLFQKSAIKLLGLNPDALVKAVSPQIPKLQNGMPQAPGSIVNTMPPFASGKGGPNPTAPANQDLASRTLFNDPRDLWYLSLPTKLTPSEVIMILRSALGGDLWQQWQLQKLMADSWVMFRKCAHELRSAVSSVRYVAHPYCEQGKQASKSAKAKADCVNRGLQSWRPNQFTDEKGLQGFVYHALDSVLSGVSLEEIQWQLVGGEILPRAATWVHPRQFTFGNGGYIAIWDMNFKAMVTPDPNKFMCTQYLSDSGSALGCGLMRPLAWYWSAVIFNREWMLKYGQKYGSGFLKMFYPDGATEDEIKKLEGFAKDALNKGWIMLRKDLEDAEYTAPANLGSENPHHKLCADADEAAQLLLLGQTATTSGNKQQGGGINNNSGAVQQQVLKERKIELANNISEGPLMQLALAICRLNFDGDDTECPIIAPDTTQPLNAQDKGMVITALAQTKTPMVMADYYELTGTQPPSEGQQVINPSTGEIGIIGSMDEPFDASQAPKPDPTELDENGNPVPSSGVGGGEGGGDQSAANGNVSASEVRKWLAKASDAEVNHLKALVVKAVDTGSRNGELSAVKLELGRLAGKRK